MTGTRHRAATRLRKFGRPVGTLAVLYNLSAVAFLILRVTIGERNPVIAFANYGLMWILLLTVPAAIVSLVLLRWQAIVAIIPAAICLAFYVPQFMPKPQDETGLSVATYNITGWLDTPEKLAAFNALDVDILGIEESANPEELLKQTAQIYPYVYAQINTDISEHFALFSRYPIDTESVRFIDYLPEDWIRPASMRAVVNVTGRPISIYVMHTTRPGVTAETFNTDARDMGISATMDAIREETNPVILLCDCNMGEWTATYEQIGATLVDSWRERGVGFGLTVPATRRRAPFPLLRGDYIWHSDHFMATSVQVMPDNGGSEHFPIRAVLNLKDGS